MRYMELLPKTVRIAVYSPGSDIQSSVVLRLLCFQEMIDEADRDGDGEINEEEFLRIMKKTSLY